MIPILMIDDDQELCGLLAESLEREAIRLDAVHNGDEGLERALSGDYDLVLLDVMLPGKSGFEILRTIRRDKSLPVLIVTGRSEDVDRIVGLEMGADDYVVKPFNMRELIARIRAVLRRSGTRQDEAARPSRVTMRGVEINPGDLSASRDGRPLNLTAVEFRLLDLLVRHAGTVVPREVLCGNALGRELHPYDRTVDMHISNVRRKLGPNGGELIKTVRSAGYLFCGGC